MMEQAEFEDLVEKLKKRKEEGDIKTAIKVADKIPWDEVDDVNLLMYAANIYEEGEHFKDAKLILEYAYDVAPVKNRLYFALCLVNARCKELKDAVSYYTDFCNAFPTDNRKLLLQYYIMNAKNASLVQQKRLLEEYLSEEKDERMTFELALICDKLGEREETLEYCNFIVNFYGVKRTGYGRNALLLKKKYASLSESEETVLNETDPNYSSIDSNLEYTEPPIFYNDVRLENDQVNIPVEKVERSSIVTQKTEKDDDELDEKAFPNSISMAYTPDEESFNEKEKNKMAFLRSEKADKDKLKKLIHELKKEEKIKNSEFNKFREKSFERKGRLNKMKLSETKLHMIIEAHSKEEGVDIAKKELDYIHNALNEKVSIAKASAYNMNEKGFAFYESKINGKDLIIENAGMLKNSLLDDIEEYIVNKKGSSLFALVDIINNFDKLATDRPSFVSRFDVYSVLSNRPQESLEVNKEELEEHKSNTTKQSKAPVTRTESKETIENNNTPSTRNEEKNIQRKEPASDKIKELSIDDFIEECKMYAKSIDCSMDGDTVTSLYEKVEGMKDSGIPLTIENAAALIEEAADRAEKPKFFSKPKYDKDGCLILTGDHFDF